MLIIIFGLPGTGKSTFAKTLAETLHANHLNTDVVRSEAGLRGRYDDQVKAQVYELLYERTRQNLAQKKRVILDGTFYTEEIRAHYLQLAAEYDQPIVWIQMEAEEAVIHQRTSEKRLYSEADFEVYQKVKRLFEPLQKPHLHLHSSRLTTNQMLQKALEYIQKGEAKVYDYKRY